MYISHFSHISCSAQKLSFPRHFQHQLYHWKKSGISCTLSCKDRCSADRVVCPVPYRYRTCHVSANISFSTGHLSLYGTCTVHKQTTYSFTFPEVQATLGWHAPVLHTGIPRLPLDFLKSRPGDHNLHLSCIWTVHTLMNFSWCSVQSIYPASILYPDRPHWP